MHSIRWRVRNLSRIHREKTLLMNCRTFNISIPLQLIIIVELRAKQDKFYWKSSYKSHFYILGITAFAAELLQIENFPSRKVNISLVYLEDQPKGTKRSFFLIRNLVIEALAFISFLQQQHSNIFCQMILPFAAPFRRHTNKRREIDLLLRAKIKCHVFLE